ncbi:MAG: hypothetical protein K8S62_15500 [Candidatus Sabulitectum sp.]|nr:hypothetical protein [Candidatus Sabulitectum sp.]
MKIRSAVISFSDREMNEILKSLDIPLVEITVSCTGGKLVVRVKKGITIKINIIFAADGRHLSATVDMGILVNPLVSRILRHVIDSVSEWGVTLTDRTLIFDPQAAMKNSGIKGDFRVDKTAVGTGELVLAVDGDIPLDQFVKITKSSEADLPDSHSR